MTLHNVISPYDGHAISSITLNDDAQIEIMIQMAHELFQNKKQWMSPMQRRSILENIYQIIKVRKKDLAKLAAEEGGKPLKDSKIELERALTGIQFAKESISRMTGVEIPMELTSYSMHRKAYTHRVPIGVSLAISAFNHPINLIIHQVITAIAVGCPILIKPSLKTPLTCIELTKIFYEAGLPHPWCQMILCSNLSAEKIVSDPRIRFFSFIGSSEVGWYLRSKLSPGTKCVLEHGGAAPVIVEEDVDLDNVVPALVKGGYYHSGQVCVSVQRVYAHEKITKTLLKVMSEKIKELIVGDPLDEKTDVGPMINEGAMNRVNEWVQEAEENGGKIIVGGKIIQKTCFEPTLIFNPSRDSRVSKQEIFGPVVCVYEYNKLEEAIQSANSLPFHFQSAVFTQQIDKAFKCIKELNANTVLVNDHTAFRVDWMPFGGQNESGIGLGGIPYSMEEMTYQKLVIWHSKEI